jgi:hypothetical protein
MITKQPSATLPGTVEKVIESPHPGTPEKAAIVIEHADHLYREIRIENTLKDKSGNEVGLKQGAQVQITVKVESPTTIAKQLDRQ